MRLFLAVRAFFTVLSNKQKATEIEKCLVVLPGPRLAPPNEAKTIVQEPHSMKPSVAKAVSPKSTRNDALTLLSSLQREARLLDLVSEPLDQYSDAQIGAAARDVIRDTKKCIDKLFSLRPLVDQSEGDTVVIPDHASPVRWKITGGTNSSAASKSRGTIVHPGWIAAKVDLPSWTGGPEDDLVLSATEVEV